MKFNLLFKILLLSFALISIDVYSQNVEVKFNSIIVNSDTVSSDAYKVVLSNKDSVVFNYDVFSDSEINTDVYKFGVVFKNDQYTYNRSIGVKELKYGALEEGDYLLSIMAFDLRGRWVTDTSNFTIDVDNEKAELISELNTLKKELAKKDSLLAEKKEVVAGTSDGSPNQYLLLLLGLIAGGATGFVVAKRIKAKPNTTKTQNQTPPKPNETPKTEVTAKKEETESKEEIDSVEQSKLEATEIENGKLRAEIATYKGQIDALNTRSNELQTQNRELQKSINKLNSSKTELEDLQKQKDELFAIIIHDIKNPVSLIKNLVDLLRSYDLSAQEQSEVINDIANTTARIVSLSQEVSKILTLESSKLELQYDKVNISYIVEDIYNRNKSGANKKDIHLLYEHEENLPEVEIDINKIDEVLDNLVSNAIKFTQKGGSIRIKTYHDESNIICEVSDNGLGLSEEDIKNAFKRGKKLSARPTAGESSTGIGLWIVKKLIEAHSGRVWVKSRLGKGSTFAFSVPKVASPASANN